MDGHINNNTIHITNIEREKLNAIDAQNHTHSNKSVLDGITATLISKWNIPINTQKPTFTPASSRQNIVSGDNITLIFGKIQKWISDLKDAAFAQIANNDTTTAAGYVADARAVRTLGIEIDTANTALTTHKTSADHDGRYYTEAEVNNLLAGKAALAHLHDDRYYTETEINNKISAINTDIVGKQNANTAINTSNIGDQSVNYATWAGTANNVAWSNINANPLQFNAENTSISQMQFYYSKTYNILQIIVKLADGSSKTFTLN